MNRKFANGLRFIAAQLVCFILLLPQAIAGLRKMGPAAHLSLLLLGLISITAIFATIALQILPTADVTQNNTYYVLHISPLGIAALGLCILTPLYWAVEHFSPSADFQIDTIIAQGLALTFAVSVAGDSVLPLRLVDASAVVLVLIMLLRGIYCLLKYRTKS